MRKSSRDRCSDSHDPQEIASFDPNGLHEKRNCFE